MNKNQKCLLKGLEIVANGLMILEDAEESLKEMTEVEAKEVLDKFDKTITNFNMDEMLNIAYKTKSESNVVISQLVEKLKLDKREFKEE